MSLVALVPARSGSKRAVGKNIRPVRGHPLLAYSIAAARNSGVFDAVYVSTDSHEYAQIARDYGAETIMRPAEFAHDLSPDFYWIQHALSVIEPSPLGFATLRPTSPLRQPETIRRAWAQFENAGYDSLRACELCKQHPSKMWVQNWVTKGAIRPFFENIEFGAEYSEVGGQPSHSVPYQLLPRVYAQNASLEIAWSRVITRDRNISGSKVMPFFTEGWEGFDINRPEDFLMLETLLDNGLATLPEVTCP